jgi:hypothetical protein
MLGKPIVIASAVASLATVAVAQEGLEPFSGKWQGSGEYVRLNGDRVDVQCRLDTEASSAFLNMKGRCTALVFISRDLSADIKAEGSRISGQYSGPEGAGAVEGERAGSALDLSIRWEKQVRGDETAEMKIEMVGPDRLRLRTFDRDPATNSMVAVTDLNLQRQQ